MYNVKEVYCMNFSRRSIDFLFENCLNDSRTWFKEHKEDYEAYVLAPFRELIAQLTDTMLEIDSKFICDPKRISRIYHDARYAKGGSIFRDHIWYTFSRTTDAYESLPGFYFSISTKGFSCGCGYYYASTASMAAIRSLILDKDKAAKKALKAYKDQNVFRLYGEFYKRDHYPDAKDEEKEWLNRREIGVSCESTDFELLFSSDLGKKIAEDFRKIAPIYDMFMKAENNKGL